MITTSYGNWNANSNTVEDSVAAAIGEFAADYDIPALVGAYRAAINDALPAGVSLCGNEFYGPAYAADQHFDGYPLDEDGRLDIAAIVDAVDFWTIAEGYDHSA